MHTIQRRTITLIKYYLWVEPGTISIVLPDVDLNSTTPNDCGAFLESIYDG
ncbi:MAG TPA: hypothetical protein VGA95_14020 [Thermodesulfobacteriota bacterium]